MKGLPKVAIVGNGMLASLCGKFLVEQVPEVKLSHLFIDVSSTRLGEGLEVLGKQKKIDATLVEDYSFDQTSFDLAPDYLLSLCNSIIVPKSILEKCRLALNFHNSPLPLYAGSHSCTWAILGKETHYGVCFHQMNSKTDSGDLFLQDHFPIHSEITAGELTYLSIERGYQLFTKGIRSLIQDTFKPQKQDLTNRTFFFAKQYHEVSRIDFNWEAEKIWRHYRAFNYGLLRSPVGYLFAEFDPTNENRDKKDDKARKIFHSQSRNFRKMQRQMGRSFIGRSILFD